MKKLSIPALAVCLLPLAGCASHPRLAVVAPTDTGLVVQGEGKADAPPDLATLRVGIEAHRATMAEARAASADAQTRLLDAIRTQGVPAADVQTEQLSLEPDYEYGPSGRVLRGYVATNAVKVKVRNLSLAGPIVDATVAAGGDDARVDGVAFSLEDDAHLRDEARRRAIADARAKAESLARELGIHVGEPVAVEELSGAVPGPVMMRLDAARASGGPTPVAAGTIEATVVVRVRFAIAR